jgi:hypothetical protein
MMKVRERKARRKGGGARVRTRERKMARGTNINRQQNVLAISAVTAIKFEGRLGGVVS